MGIDLLGRAKLQHMQAHESKEHAQMLAVLPPIEEGPGQEQMPAVVPAIKKQDVPGAHAAVLLCCLLGILVASTSLEVSFNIAGGHHERATFVVSSPNLQMWMVPAQDLFEHCRL